MINYVSLNKLSQNLDKIDEQNQIKFDTIYNKNVNININITTIDKNIIIKNIDDLGEVNFTIEKHIGYGTFSNVYKVIDTNLNIVAGLKVEKLIEPDISEKDISELLNQSSCNLLKVKYIGKTTSKLNVYLMELADGDLRNLPVFYIDNPENTKITLNFYRNIVEEIRKQMVFLLKKSDYKYVYTDIKLANILYKCINENTIRIFLGDLGSAVPIQDNYYIATYPPWEYINSEEKSQEKGVLKLSNQQDKEYTISWMLGILLLSFVYPNITSYAYCNLHDIDIYTHNKIVKHFINKLYGPSFVYYLNANKQIRTNIYNPLPDIYT